MSVMVSEMTPQRDGHGDPPKVILKATRRKSSKIVRLSKAVLLEKVHQW
jgi:hypothetical protein